MRGSRPGESHGGAFIIDLEQQALRQVLSCDATDIDWQDSEGGRGLRGIAIHEETIFVAASDALLAYDREFRNIGRWRNHWLKQCQGIAAREGNLFLVSAGYDSILAFDIDRRKFHWALHVDMQGQRFKGAVYDPEGGDGPLMLDKLGLDTVAPQQGGMYVSGTNTGGMLHFNGKHVRMSVSLAGGANDLQPFRDGVLFNDTRNDRVRYVSREGTEDRSIAVPKYEPAELTHAGAAAGDARQGFPKGLCVLSDRAVAGGSSPATVTVYDLEGSRQLMSVRMTADVRHGIHSIAGWPFDQGR